ncbi:MAG: adenylate kinase [Dysgonamonadaceae bacterium]|jgi:adenylate kinase|nr:adenylate kinase [Dysgonamonadaceae bacterium]
MLNIVIFGAPGSGKGTQSELIIKKYGLCHISTGEILREEIKDQTNLGLISKEYISQGHLVPDQLVMEKFTEILDKTSGVKGYIFDGFPRTIFQAQALDALLLERKTPVVATFSLSVEEKELIRRLLKRGTEAGRNDDNPETIKKRLEIYKERTEPIKEYYRKKGKLFKIEGNGSVEDVFEGITDAIDRLVY